MTTPVEREPLRVTLAELLEAARARTPRDASSRLFVASEREADRRSTAADEIHIGPAPAAEDDT